MEATILAKVESLQFALLKARCPLFVVETLDQASPCFGVYLLMATVRKSANRKTAIYVGVV